jgi:hypothetical protein
VLQQAAAAMQVLGASGLSARPPPLRFHVQPQTGIPQDDRNDERD